MNIWQGNLFQQNERNRKSCLKRDGKFSLISQSPYDYCWEREEILFVAKQRALGENIRFGRL